MFLVSYSFHWNLAYANLLWEENIVRSLKSTSKVIWSLVHCNSIGSHHTHIGALLPECWSTSIKLWINRKYTWIFVLFLCYTHFLYQSGFLCLMLICCERKTLFIHWNVLPKSFEVWCIVIQLEAITLTLVHCCLNAEVHQLNCELIGSIHQILCCFFATHIFWIGVVLWWLMLICCERKTLFVCWKVLLKSFEVWCIVIQLEAITLT